MTVIDSPSVNRDNGRHFGMALLDGRLSITEIAGQLGISTKTITRWEKAGKIRKAKRDWKGWRIYSPEDLEQMRGFVETVY